jgi:hypothetical protein
MIRVMTTHIPRRFEDITPQTLTALLSGSAGPHAAVQRVGIEPIGRGVGFLGQLARLRLTYDRSEATPRTLIAKLPTVEPGGREICRLAMDVAADGYLILLEDLGALRMGDDAGGCSAADAEVAIRSLARWHATWWGDARLDRMDWVPMADAPVHQSAEPAYQKALVPFLKTFGDFLSPKVRDLTERMSTHIIDLLKATAPSPVAMAHGDFRLDNLFFENDDVAMIDWQIAFRGRAAFDVAYFLSGCLDPGVRRAEEMRLLRLWYDIAVRDRTYTFDEALIDYRRSVLYCNVYTVIAIGSLDPSNERGMSVFRAWLQRRGAAMEDLDAGELMPR